MGKITLYVGLIIVIFTVLGFIFLVIRELPTDQEISSTAKPLQNLPSNFFQPDFPLNSQIRELNVPGGVPVQLNQQNLGRSNVFLNF